VSAPALGVAQSRVFRSAARFVTLVAGRRFGKTTLIGVRQYHQAVCKPNQECRVIFPTYKQGKDIFWRPLKDMIPPAYIRRKNESELSIELVNGSRVQLLGANNPDSLRGPGLDLADFDEFADIDPITWDEVIRPALADKQGRAGFFGTPKGYNHFYDAHMRGVAKKPGWEAFTFTTAHGGRVFQSEILEARADLDPRVFRQEFEASFETLQGRVYANFTRHGWPTGNWDSAIIDLGRDLYVGMDFNINPMSAVIVQDCLGWPQVLGELELQSSNTQEMCEALRAKYPDRRMIVCPDASGAQQGTNAPLGQTDLSILAANGFEVLVNRSNPRVHDRVNNVQSLLKSGSGRRRLTLRPSTTPRLTKCLEGLTWKEGTNQQDKDAGLDHLPDALGYVLWQKWNILAHHIPSANVEGGVLHSPFGSELLTNG
jgi:hypothetical protein